MAGFFYNVIEKLFILCYYILKINVERQYGVIKGGIILMNSLYIIGNGFDLAHGLDTSYWHFRMFLENKDYEFLTMLEKLYNIEQLDETEYGYNCALQTAWEKRIKAELWSEFEKHLGLPNTQYMLDISASVLGNLNLESGNIGIIDTMDHYWRKQFGFIKKLQNYVEEWISQIEFSGILPKKTDLVENNKDYFFSFNYTRTLEDTYKIDNVLHIHGSIGQGSDMSPFMGHCNQQAIKEHLELHKEAYENGNEGEASIQSAIGEYLKEIFKDTEHYIGMNYHFFDHLKTVSHVIIIGWSAGDVDIPYLCKIRDSVAKDTIWTVYYYDDKAYNDLQAALASNGITDSFETEFFNAETFWNR